MSIENEISTVSSSSKWTNSQSSLISELVKTSGECSFCNSKYVCHTSSIPLSTIVDDSEYLRKSDPSKVCHFIHSDTCCTKNHCMHYGKKSGFHHQNHSKDCPCGQFIYDNEALSPICFLSFVRKLSNEAGKPLADFQPREVAFCFDHVSILQNTYPLWLKNKVKISGYHKLGKGDLFKLLMNTYWFRKYYKEYNLGRLIQSVEQKYLGDNPSEIAVLEYLKTVEQVLSTIDNVLVKKFLALSVEISGYSEISFQTAFLFKSLYEEYFAESREELSESVYEDLKDFYNQIKMNFNHESYNKRNVCLNYQFKTKTGRYVFGRELQRLKKYILHREVAYDQDYTTSIAWCSKFTTLCQTRSLGHLPHYLKRERVNSYWELVSRAPDQVETEKVDTIHRAVQQELSRAGIDRNYLNKDNNMKKTIEASKDLGIKNSASVLSTVKEGGKLEDARSLLTEIRQHKWKIPIRNLDSFQITNYLPVLKAKDLASEKIDINGYIFWTSLQMTINVFTHIGLVEKKFYYPLKKDNKDYYEEKLFDAKLLSIDEPGKCRILIKSHPMYNWTLAVGSSMCQKILALHQDHRAGLEAGSHDWHHMKRISGETQESAWMYDNKGRLRDFVRVGYTDWTEATDKMSKRIGIAHVRSYMQYINFPSEYGKLIMNMIRLPQKCEEDSFSVRGGKIEKIHRKGIIREGFMMGNQMTKTVLHLAHVSEQGIARQYLKERMGKTVSSRDAKHLRGKKVPYSAEEGYTKAHNSKRK